MGSRLGLCRFSFQTRLLSKQRLTIQHPVRVGALRMPSYVPFLIAGYVGWMASATLADEIDAGNLTYDQHVKTTLSAYCMDCHGADEPEAALNLARFDIDSVDVSEA